MDGVRITGMTFLILIGSSTFSQILAFSGATSGFVELAAGLDLAPTTMLLCMLAVLLVLGMFMDQLSMMLLTLPIFMPIASGLGFDPIWVRGDRSAGARDQPDHTRPSASSCSS